MLQRSHRPLVRNGAEQAREKRRDRILRRDFGSTLLRYQKGVGRHSRGCRILEVDMAQHIAGAGDGAAYGPSSSFGEKVYLPGTPETTIAIRSTLSRSRG
jgi:hypothetical protein